MISAPCDTKHVLVRKWGLAGMCWCSLWGVQRAAYGELPSAQAQARLTPQAWLEQYLGVRFPISARHFVFSYRSDVEDVVLFCLDLAREDLEQLLDGKAVFPAYRDLAKGSVEFPEPFSRDPTLGHFAQRVTALWNPLSVTSKRVQRAESWEVRVWTAERTAGVWEVCVLLITGKHAEKAVAHENLPRPAAAREMHTHVTIDSRLEHRYDTGVWQRWTLDEAGYRQFLQEARTHSRLVKYGGPGEVERLADRLSTWGPGTESSWWRPAELNRGVEEASRSLEGFRLGESQEDRTLVLILGRTDGLFLCYAHAQCHTITPDPRDAIWTLLGLDLPASVSEVCYASDSNLAGQVGWVRFDLPRPDLVTCLARTATLPVYAEFTTDAAVREHLETAYRTGAPAWWQPQELQEGRYAQRRRDTKELHGLHVGLGRLPGETVRVYIGTFTAL
ncbi:MAG: hypothetical protein MUC88_00715 [Planctomycetes bacterium]|nr:hypothetical protein [Planctomycetota bacterium]